MSCLSHWLKVFWLLSRHNNIVKMITRGLFLPHGHHWSLTESFARLTFDLESKILHLKAPCNLSPNLVIWVTLSFGYSNYQILSFFSKLGKLKWFHLVGNHHSHHERIGSFTTLLQIGEPWHSHTAKHPHPTHNGRES